MEDRTEYLNSGEQVTIINTDNRGYGVQHQVIRQDGSMGWINDSDIDDDD